MQHIDNDMDDLFKRAAEGYPLLQGAGDWENVAKRIADKSDDDIVPVAGNNNKKIIIVCLLMLILPVSWFITTHNSTPISSVATNGIKIEKGNKLTQQVIKISDQPAQNKEEKNDDVATVDNLNNHYKSKLLKVKGAGNISVKVTLANDSTSPDTDDAGKISNKKKQEKEPVTVTTGNNFTGKKDVKENAANTPVEELVTNEQIPGKGNPAKERSTNRVKQIDSPAIAQNNRKEKKAALRKKKEFYIGIVAGPDLSKVQSMAFSNAGIYGGLIAGRYIGKRLSLETGITWNKKYYNSQGSDFSMDKVGATMATGMVIDNLASNSSLIEIPVKVKYDFISKKNSAFFIAGGISAYIMTSEKNKYNVTMNGNQEKITGTYNKNNYGLPAVVNISAGYQRSINERLQIRIEPFLKVPLKGMGVGSLPITSTGLQVGIISRLK